VTGSASSGGAFDEAALRSRIKALELDTARPDLWEDRERAERLLREKSSLERDLAQVDRLAEAQVDRLAEMLEDVEVLLELADEADDPSTRAEAAEKLGEAEEELAEAELQCLLGGEHDASNAIVSINSGAGGTDAADWAEMLLRMYLRWAERHHFQSEILDIQSGEEAGLRSVTVTLSGAYAYGYLKTEEGVHRLVRISPFDAQHRRHTAFASVSVFPELDDSIEIDIDHRRQGSARGHLPGQRRRRAARQQDGFGGPADPRAHGHRRPVSERTLPAQEPRPGREGAARAAVRAGSTREGTEAG
jgi:peptide chain release factor 2